jgi:hypothetical protein
MEVCSEVEPPEVFFPDGVRVACHLHPPGRDGGIAVSPADVAARSHLPVLDPVVAPGWASGSPGLPPSASDADEAAL